MTTDKSRSPQVSPLIPIGTIILVIAAAIFIYTGNTSSFHGHLLANGTAVDKNSSAGTWFMMGAAEAASAAGMALGLGLLAGGVASTVCAATRSLILENRVGRQP